MTITKTHYEGEEYDRYNKYADELNELFDGMNAKDVLTILCNYIAEGLQDISSKEQLTENIQTACDLIRDCAMDENPGRVQ